MPFERFYFVTASPYLGVLVTRSTQQIPLNSAAYRMFKGGLSGGCLRPQSFKTDPTLL